jgi:hypothetical protein
VIWWHCGGGYTVYWQLKRNWKVRRFNIANKFHPLV